MENELDIAIVHNLKDIEFFTIKVTEAKKELIIERLHLEQRKIESILKKLKIENKIKSTKKPKNLVLTKELKNIIRARRNIKKSIKILRTIM